MADKIRMAYTDHFEKVMRAMTRRGLLLATWKDEPAEANAMTIGWGMIGSIWSRPVWQVLVRPSRYTYRLLEKDHRFSINVLPTARSEALTLCGTVSGAKVNKLAQAGLHVALGGDSGAPVIQESIIYYECHVLHSNDFLPEKMVPDIRTGCYPSGDYHRVYWGEIVGCGVDPTELDALA